MNKLNSSQEVQLVKNLQPVRLERSIWDCTDYSKEFKTHILQIQNLLALLQKNIPDITGYILQHSLCGEAQEALSEYVNKPNYEYITGLLYILKYQGHLNPSVEYRMAKHCPFRYFAGYSPEASLLILSNDYHPVCGNFYWSEKMPYSFMTELNHYAQSFGFDYRGLEILLSRLEHMPWPMIEITDCKYDMYDERCDSQFLVKYLFYQGQDISNVNHSEQYMLADYLLSLRDLRLQENKDEFRNMRETIAKYTSAKFFGEDKEFPPILVHEKKRHELSKHPSHIYFRNSEILLYGKNDPEYGHTGYFCVIKNSFIYQNHNEKVDDLIAAYYQRTGNICYLVLLRESLIFNHGLSLNAMNCLLKSDYSLTLPVSEIKNEKNIVQILVSENVDLAIKIIDSRKENLTLGQQELLFSSPKLEAARANYLSKFTPNQMIMATLLPSQYLLESLNENNLLEPEVLNYIADNPLYKDVIERNNELIRKREEKANDSALLEKDPASFLGKIWKSLLH